MNGRGGDEQWAEEIGQIVGPLLTPIAFECGRCMPMVNLFLELCPAALRAKLNGLSIYRILFIEIALRGHVRPHATIVKYAVSPDSARQCMGEVATSSGPKRSGKSSDHFIRQSLLSVDGAC